MTIDDHSSDKKRLAWETAIKRLDFEINLLWQRGLYFWTFIAATFVAYFSISDGNAFEKTIIAAFGFLISLAWCLANMGSKYWQGVWEVKVKALEIDITGELYSWIPTDEMSKKKDWLRGRRFSVSRIAIAVSGLVTLCWFGLLLRQSFGWQMDAALEMPCLTIGMSVILGIVLAWLSYSDD